MTQDAPASAASRTKAALLGHRPAEDGDRQRQAAAQRVDDQLEELDPLIGSELADLGREPEAGQTMRTAGHARLDLTTHQPGIDPPARIKEGVDDRVDAA